MLLNLLLVLEVIVGALLTGVVLLQRSEGGGFVSGGTSSMMSVRGAGDLLTRITWILGTMFFVLGLLLTIVAGREQGTSSVVDRLKVNAIDPSSLARDRQAPAQQAPAPLPGGQAPLQAPAPTVDNPFLAPPPAAPQPAAPAPK
jgi:preprotein translocase subunit SecG